METRRGPAGNTALVAVLVTATGAAGSVLAQVFGRGVHTHGGVPVSALAVTVDAAGLAAVALLSLQLMSGYHLVRLRGERFRRLHVPAAWGLAGVLAYHAAFGVYHSLEAPVEALPLALDGIGLVLLALTAAQIATGYGRSSPAARGARLTHALAALALAAVAVTHGVLGIAHTVSG